MVTAQRISSVAEGLKKRCGVWGGMERVEGGSPGRGGEVVEDGGER